MANIYPTLKPSRKMIAIIRVVLFAMLSFISQLAMAQTDRDTQAKTAFEEGITNSKAGRYEQAVESFRRAYKLKPSWKILFNIGQCEAALKNYGLAFESLETYLVEGGDEIVDERQQAVREELGRLRDLSAELSVSGPEGGVVLVDGESRSTLPLVGRIRLAAGRHEIGVIHKEISLGTQQIKVSGRDQVELDFTPGSSSRGTQDFSSAKPSDSSRPLLRSWGWVTLGLGAVAGIVGGVTGGMALSKIQSLEERCPNDTCQTSADIEDRDAATTLGIVTDIMLPLAGALIITGGTLLIVDRFSKRDAQEKLALSATPWLHPNSGGLAIEGRF